MLTFTMIFTYIPSFSEGLWQACFDNYHDYRYLYDRIYDGCYWTLAEEMHVIEDQMRRRERCGDMA